MLGAGASDTVRFAVTNGWEPFFTTIGSTVASSSAFSAGFSGNKTAADGLPSLPTDAALFFSEVVGSSANESPLMVSFFECAPGSGFDGADAGDKAERILLERAASAWLLA